MHLSKSEVRYLRSLSQKKFRDAERKFLVEGWRAVQDALNSTFRIELAAVLPKYRENDDYRSIFSQLQDSHVAVKEITEIELGQISSTVHSQGIVALVHQKKYDRNEIFDGMAGLVVVADGISDPGNLGSVVRTCDWFGVDAVILGKGSVELYNEKVVRATAGSVFHIPIIEDSDLGRILSDLKDKEFFIAATAGEAKDSYVNLPKRRKTALILGSEARGINKEVRQAADLVVGIPKIGQAESLNVGVACGIILAHLKKSEILIAPPTGDASLAQKS